MTLDVLVADNAPFMRSLLSEVLGREHRVVGTAENGVEAVELARKHEPAVVVLDATLPIRDGVDATEEIVADVPGVGVVICTTVEDEEGIEAARAAGATEYVVKPFQASNLLAAVADAATS